MGMSNAGSLMTCGRIGRTLPIESLGGIPSIAVEDAVLALLWALPKGRDPQEAMLNARTALRLRSRDHGRALGQAHHGERNTRCLGLFRYEAGAELVEELEGPTHGTAIPPRELLPAMRAALELDVALGVQEAAEERRHAKAREDADRDAAIMRKVQEGR